LYALAIDQSEVRVSDELTARGAPGFPRPLAWWQRYVPIWLAVTEGEQGRLTLEPNGRRADGVVLEVTPALRRRHLRCALNRIAYQIHLDYSTAVSHLPSPPDASSGAPSVSGRHPQDSSPAVTSTDLKAGHQ
jgi:hypothetical protein